ncbi:uncharacterized protein LOC113501291 isoform X2 [Trichoplusia ni]|uniref:Uncharacterized protein LOC113501291 isoform X2 n=1 Tax=Trichoplusia ni TaxID=7111 RepID=A0A7E5WC13_TRINI|nr:uncharacterized protein LOC113501291 isoform X2 [Trichoplusia ni]
MMWRRSGAVLLLAALLLHSFNCGDARPFFGLLNLLLNGTGFYVNGTATASGSGSGVASSLLETLVLAHEQHNLAKLQFLENLLGIGPTATGTATGTGDTSTVTGTAV